MIRVLIVDDEPFIRQGLKIIINWDEYGFEIADEAANGIEAVELLEKNQYDLVITDIKMPQMNGIELIKHIRKNISQDLKIMVLSGYYEFEYAKQAIRYNVVEYILKPIQKEELIRTLLEFKEAYIKQVKNTEHQKYTEQIVLERHLNALCFGICDKNNIKYIYKKLPWCRQLRYISVEVSPNDEAFIKLTEEEKKDAIKYLYEEFRDYLKPNEEYVLLDMDKRNEVYGIGFIYAKEFSLSKGISEQEYISHLQEYLSMKQPYKINFYIGQMVDDVEQLGFSFKSAIIAKSFQNYKNDKDIAYYDETTNTKMNTYGIEKEYMDELIHYTEQNLEDEIGECVDKMYLNFKKCDVDPKIINISIDYLLCQFIFLAKKLDTEVDQEEILSYISQCAFEQSAIRGSAKHFKAFVKEFAGYLAQLRKNNSNSVLRDVEKEIEVYYMKNLSLKSLSEKYYINSAYLGQIFKKKHGISFKDYLNNYRIEKACELLIRTNDKVYNIAELVGYNNLDYFISKFVRLKGKTPLQYRKQFLQKNK